MKRSSAMAVVAILALLWPRPVTGQHGEIEVTNPARLEVTAEVAASTEKGQPAALRITLRNNGYVAVDLPMPGVGCGSPDGAIEVKYEWHSNDPQDSSGRGGGCLGGMTDRPPLIDRAKNEWIRLQPGEFLTVTHNIRPMIRSMDPGIVEYWCEYSPPVLKKDEIAALRRSGYLVPMEKTQTPRQAFKID